jgi:hypothetical protein
VNITLYLDVHDGGLTYLINGYTWNETVPKEPYLVSLYKNDSVEWPSMERALENDGLDPIARAFPARMDEVIEIVIQNSGSARGKLESHPWHAHGAHVWDLGSGNGVYDCVANEAKWANSTGKPILREYVFSPISSYYLLNLHSTVDKCDQIKVARQENTNFIIVRHWFISMGLSRDSTNFQGGELGD